MNYAIKLEIIRKSDFIGNLSTESYKERLTDDGNLVLSTHDENIFSIWIKQGGFIDKSVSALPGNNRVLSESPKPWHRPI